MNDKIVLWLSRRPEQAEQRLIGPKATSLCILHRLEMKVPACFFLTTSAFTAHLDTNALRAQIAPRLENLNAQPEKTPEAIEEIRRHRNHTEQLAFSLRCTIYDTMTKFRRKPRTFTPKPRVSVFPT